MFNKVFHNHGCYDGALSTSGTSVNFCEALLHNITENDQVHFNQSLFPALGTVNCVRADRQMRLQIIGDYW